MKKLLPYLLYTVPFVAVVYSLCDRYNMRQTLPIVGVVVGVLAEKARE
jgi:hypothetical protein